MRLVCKECAISINPVFRQYPEELNMRYAEACYNDEVGTHYHVIDCELCAIHQAMIELNVNINTSEGRMAYEPQTREEVITLIEDRRTTPQKIEQQKRIDKLFNA